MCIVLYCTRYSNRQYYKLPGSCNSVNYNMSYRNSNMHFIKYQHQTIAGSLTLINCIDYNIKYWIWNTYNAVLG